jgi:hypothetical protein
LERLTNQLPRLLAFQSVTANDRSAIPSMSPNRLATTITTIGEIHFGNLDRKQVVTALQTLQLTTKPDDAFKISEHSETLRDSKTHRRCS